MPLSSISENGISRFEVLAQLEVRVRLGGIILGLTRIIPTKGVTQSAQILGNFGFQVMLQVLSVQNKAKMRDTRCGYPDSVPVRPWGSIIVDM